MKKDLVSVETPKINKSQFFLNVVLLSLMCAAMIAHVMTNNKEWLLAIAIMGIINGVNLYVTHKTATEFKVTINVKKGDVICPQGTTPWNKNTDFEVKDVLSDNQVLIQSVLTKEHKLIPAGYLHFYRLKE